MTTGAINNASKASEALIVAEDSASDTLSKCVEKALEHYLQQLNGHSTESLHQMVMREVEEPLYRTALKHVGSNQSKAAKLLGISRSTLRKKIATYNLE